jgi:hypothetical protein
MCAPSNCTLLAVLPIILLAQLTPAPTAAQSFAEHDQHSSRFAGPLRDADGDAPGTVIMQGKTLASMLGREVRTRVEEDVGRIIDLLADRNGQVQAAVIELGGFLGIGTRKIAVEWSALSFEPKGPQSVVILEMTRDQLRMAPEYRPSEPAIVRRAVQ